VTDDDDDDDGAESQSQSSIKKSQIEVTLIVLGRFSELQLHKRCED
jgi:hypothetical protein